MLGLVSGDSFGLYTAGKGVYCVPRTGSIVLNIQKIETITEQQLPTSVMILNDLANHPIRQTHRASFAGNMLEIKPDTRLAFPGCQKI